MTMREKMVRAIIEKWHPGGMDRSLIENGMIIVPPNTLREAEAAVDAALDALMDLTEGMIEVGQISLAMMRPKLRDMTVCPWQDIVRAIKDGK